MITPLKGWLDLRVLCQEPFSTMLADQATLSLRCLRRRVQPDDDCRMTQPRCSVVLTNRTLTNCSLKLVCAQKDGLAVEKRVLLKSLSEPS